MNIETIAMDPEVARQAYRDYQAAVRAERRDVRSAWKAEDVALARGYRQLAKGRSLLDVGAAMRTAGLREGDGFPKLAIARSDLAKVFCSFDYDGGAIFHSEATLWGYGRRVDERVHFPKGTFAQDSRSKGQSRATLVPIIPPALRPKTNLSSFHTLWEVESWTLEPPKDPLLLRHLGGELYVVLAVWDLTELERAVLSGRAKS